MAVTMGMADDGPGGPGGLIRELRLQAEAIWNGFRPGQIETARLMLAAADTLGEQRRTIEASRLWWDDADPYHAEWNHSATCWPGHECRACVARRLAMEALGEAERSGM